MDSVVKKSKIFREVNAIITIAIRDVLTAIKTPGMLIINLAMPAVMMGMLGGSLSQNMSSGLNFDYNEFMFVGMFVNTLFMMTIMGITNLVEDRSQNFTQEIFISPISRYSIVLGKIIGSSISAIFQLTGLFVVALIMGINITLSQFLTLLAVSPFVCLVAGALAMCVIAFIKNSKMVSVISMVLLFPQMFLSGVMIPISNSSGILYVLSRMMPMTYCLDLVRSIFYHGSGYTPLFNPIVSITVIITLTIFFLVLGTYFFARTEVNR